MLTRRHPEPGVRLLRHAVADMLRHLRLGQLVELYGGGCVLPGRHADLPLWRHLLRRRHEHVQFFVPVGALRLCIGILLRPSHP